jgi:hypothetical protein
MAMIREVAPKTASGDKDSVVDLHQLISSMFESWPEKRIEFLAICCEGVEIKDSIEKIHKKFIEENAYPEEINEAFEVCMKLNKVGENLKNSAGPIRDLGAALPTPPESKSEPQA